MPGEGLFRRPPGCPTGPVLAGLGLLLLAGGIARGKRVAFRLTVILLLATIVFELVKDLDPLAPAARTSRTRPPRCRLGRLGLGFRGRRRRASDKGGTDAEHCQKRHDDQGHGLGQVDPKGRV